MPWRQEKKGSPTVFEVETALSFLYFKEKKCDIVVLETGLGGTLDATNVVKTTVMEMISSIGMDHMEFLGGTLQEIAENKAGIIKPRTWVVSAEQDPQAAAVIRRVCREKECRLSVVDPDAFQDVHYGYDRQTFFLQGLEGRGDHPGRHLPGHQRGTGTGGCGGPAKFGIFPDRGNR